EVAELCPRRLGRGRLTAGPRPPGRRRCPPLACRCRGGLRLAVFLARLRGLTRLPCPPHWHPPPPPPLRPPSPPPFSPPPPPAPPRFLCVPAPRAGPPRPPPPPPGPPPPPVARRPLLGPGGAAPLRLAVFLARLRGPTRLPCPPHWHRLPSSLVRRSSVQAAPRPSGSLWFWPAPGAPPPSPSPPPRPPLPPPPAPPPPAPPPPRPP